MTPDFYSVRETMGKLNVSPHLQSAVIAKLEDQWKALPDKYNPNAAISVSGKAVAPLRTATSQLGIRTVKAKIIELIQKKYA